MKHKLGSIIIIIIFFSIISWLLVKILDNKIENNCWSHYATEQEAIKFCEVSYEQR